MKDKPTQIRDRHSEAVGSAAAIFVYPKKYVLSYDLDHLILEIYNSLNCSDYINKTA